MIKNKDSFSSMYTAPSFSSYIVQTFNLQVHKVLPYIEKSEIFSHNKNLDQYTFSGHPPLFPALFFYLIKFDFSF